LISGRKELTLLIVCSCFVNTVKTVIASFTNGLSDELSIGPDVYQATISVAVMDWQGKVIIESILETKTSTILEFFAGLHGSLFVTFEEGTWAAWLYDLLKPHVTEVLACNPSKIPLLKHGNKSDKIDARKLAERLRLHDLKPVYHGVRVCISLLRTGAALLPCT
jgi:hypothetical protein